MALTQAFAHSTLEGQGWQLCDSIHQTVVNTMLLALNLILIHFCYVIMYDSILPHVPLICLDTAFILLQSVFPDAIVIPTWGTIVNPRARACASHWFLWHNCMESLTFWPQCVTLHHQISLCQLWSWLTMQNSPFVTICAPFRCCAHPLPTSPFLESP